jgi:hypothetical protein
MQTKSPYEEMALKTLREIPHESLPEAIKILRSLKQSILAARHEKRKDGQESGFCGAWQDSRSAEEIVEDLHAHRTGFGGRGIEL